MAEPWFSENGLIFNLKKGKTEALLCGAVQRIQRIHLFQDFIKGTF